jgi:hypothetical protein
VKFIYSEREFILDQCIEANLFPELDSFTCPICFKNLGLIEGDDGERFMKDMKKKHEVREKKLFNIFPFLLFGVPSFDYAMI